MALRAQYVYSSCRALIQSPARICFRRPIYTGRFPGFRALFVRRSWRTANPVSQHPREIDIHGVHGFVNHEPVFAATASETSTNLISEAFARQCGLEIRPVESHPVIVMINGCQLPSVGSAKTHWAFKDEPSSYSFEFSVLKEINHPVILGHHLLETTETLSTNWHRLQAQSITSSGSPCYIVGEPRASIAGSLESVPVRALPATGTDLNLVSMDFLLANRLIRRVRKSKESRTLDLLDGTTFEVDKSLILYWKFGNDRDFSWPAEFGVVPNLPCDVVLGNEMLFGAGAFQEYSDCIKMEPPTKNKLARSAVGAMPAIMLAFRRKPGLQQAMKYAGDTHIVAELSRRASADHTILTLGEKERGAAYAAEQARRSNWNMCQRPPEGDDGSFARKMSTSDHLQHYSSIGSQNHSMLAPTHAQRIGTYDASLHHTDSHHSEDSSSGSSSETGHDAGWTDSYDSDHR